MKSGKKILLDEMYTGLQSFLQVLGWEVLSIEDVGLKGQQDQKVIEYAEGNGLILVTQDQKISDLARLKGVPFVLVGYVEVARIIDERLKGLTA
jgi:predicted nuclease of predicted toxin-antitoxin system